VAAAGRLLLLDSNRRPTETAVEVLVGHDLGQLAAKLRAERDQDDHHPGS
jgi:hypothetical protein